MYIKVDEDRRLLLCRPTGVFDIKLAEEILHFLEGWESSRQGGYNRLCDMTRLDAIHLSVAEIKQVALRRRLFNVNPVHVKTAFLADNPLTFGIVAMYAAYYEDTQESPRIVMRSFRCIADADAWLRSGPS